MFQSRNFFVNIIHFLTIFVNANEDAKRLLDDLFSSYDPVVRPVADPSQTIRLSIGLKLSQIADIKQLAKISPITLTSSKLRAQTLHRIAFSTIFFNFYLEHFRKVPKK
ncbi:acetylcholine receptor subunit alpha-like isoform X1 [Brachionus plicatilis]|uniref:Acetylcholine receptor subunit alpha-like isoform X1 n=1 Tax=Brachionus plicatilis TaxID=10195 RepID=A0A3M7Q6N6_BRAPC|nr:acetylcholine receptor subunit alpha-like isoform X1 [Brachionus plicatilis]